MSDEQVSAPQRSLPLEISVATRTQHSSLNRLIMSRLRLCLPPYTQTPQLYACGLSIFGSIYTSFEKEWLWFLAQGTTDTSKTEDILQILHIPKLLRKRSLEHELASLNSYISNFTNPEEALSIIQAHQSAIRMSIHAKPHTLLAYTWVMYMALFNGGRMIRDQLATAGPEFWQVSKAPADFQEGLRVILAQRLQFWHFDSDTDGDDIKEDFKKRFDIAAAQLTASERVDVVDEAVRIFEMCRQMVDWLDTNTGAGLNANQDLKQQLVQSYKIWYHSASLAAASLALDIWGFLWGLFVSICCYLFDGRTEYKKEVGKTMVIESGTTPPTRL